MHVIKRDGRREDVSFDKVTSRIKKLCYGLTEVVDPTMLSQKVVQGIFAGKRARFTPLLTRSTKSFSAVHY